MFKFLYFDFHINLIPRSAIPESALYEEESDDEDEVVGDQRDDERTGTRYNVCSILDSNHLLLTQASSTHGSMLSL